jgi:hypothetical protein
MNTLVVEKKFDEAYSPKFTEPQKSNENTNPYFRPEINEFAPAHFITVVIKNPIANDVTTIAHTIN